MPQEYYGGCATDIIVVRRPDGTLVSTPFHVFFGKKCANAVVDMTVNGKPVPVNMKVNERGSSWWCPPLEENQSKISSTNPNRTAMRSVRDGLSHIAIPQSDVKEHSFTGVEEENSPSCSSLIDSREFEDFEDSRSEPDLLDERGGEIILNETQSISPRIITPLFCLNSTGEDIIGKETNKKNAEDKKGGKPMDSIVTTTAEKQIIKSEENVGALEEGESREGEITEGGGRERRAEGVPTMDNCHHVCASLPRVPTGEVEEEKLVTLPSVQEFVTVGVANAPLESLPEEKLSVHSLSPRLVEEVKHIAEYTPSVYCFQPCVREVSSSPSPTSSKQQQPSNNKKNSSVAREIEIKNRTEMEEEVRRKEEMPGTLAAVAAPLPHPYTTLISSGESKLKSRSSEPSSKFFPSHQQLLQMSLQYGENEIDFTIRGQKRGCRAFIYLWDNTDRLIISDVDGTITKSDLLGHACEFAGLGARWLHPGICSFFADIKRNGYHVVYLSARSMSQARSTRKFLWGLHQGKVYLPRGPLFSFPGSFFHAIRQEIWQRSHIFKAHCLREIKEAFSETAKPFFAGFGNRYGDYVAYSKAGLSGTKIFLLNSSSRVKLSSMEFHLRSAIDPSLLDARFPPRRHRHEMNAHSSTSTSHCVEVGNASALLSCRDEERNKGGEAEENELREGDMEFLTSEHESNDTDPSEEIKKKKSLVTVLPSTVASLSPSSCGSEWCETTPTLPAFRLPTSSDSSSVVGNAIEKGELSVKRGEAFFSPTKNNASDFRELGNNSIQRGGLHMATLSMINCPHEMDLEMEQEFSDNRFWRIDPVSLINSSNSRSRTPNKIPSTSTSLISSPLEASKKGVPSLNSSVHSSRGTTESVSSGRRFYFFGGKVVHPLKKPA